MWGFTGFAGLFAFILTALWLFVYFRSQFGPLSNEENWIAGLWNIRVHQLIVLSVGTIAAVTLGKVLAVLLQTVVLTWRMGRVRGRVQRLAKRTKDRQFSLDEAVLASGRSQSFTEAGLVCDAKKILICQASVGAGHKRAAEAIEAVLKQHPRGKDMEVKTIDAMDSQFADRVFTYFYKDWYLKLASGESPFGSMGGLLVSFFFDKANVVQKGQLTGGGFLNNRRLCMTMILNFLDFLCEFEPDVIVHTHFLTSEIVAGLRRHHNYTVPQVSVVTDMDVHAWWYQEPCEKYFVPRGLAQYQLELHGVDPEHIQVTGIPIMPCFEALRDQMNTLTLPEKRERFRTQMDCDLDLWQSSEDSRPVILLMSGGSNILSVFENLTKLETPSIVVVVCGRQDDLRAKLRDLPVPKHHRVNFVGYTQTMHELMAVADVIVTKPGGLITSEALACGLMITIVDPYAGQEERNASMLLEEGAAIQVHDYNLLAFRLDPILKHTETLERYKANAARLAKPDAARQIVDCIMCGNLSEAAAQADEDGLHSPVRAPKSDGKSEITAPRERSDSLISTSLFSWFESAEMKGKATHERLLPPPSCESP